MLVSPLLKSVYRHINETMTEELSESVGDRVCRFLYNHMDVFVMDVSSSQVCRLKQMLECEVCFGQGIADDEPASRAPKPIERRIPGGVERKEIERLRVAERGDACSGLRGSSIGHSWSLPISES
jgi:hypothetical protein